MAPAPTAKTDVKAKAGELFWINADGSDGGFMTPAVKQTQCGDQEVLCARGYESLNPDGSGAGPATPILGDQE
ncbi:hypothetical protein ATE47_01405 [Chryseobacterium sp. IHB B 17019]|nr:hypothetical protein ATE47_01405 [Chryseobacterium sp. IHB B 17019]